MKTYQDLEAVKDNETELKNFILSAIQEYINSDDYKIATESELYYKNRNPEIEANEKIVYDLNGLAHKDEFSPNSKIKQNYYFILINQAVMYTLGNGIAFDNEATKEKLGGDALDSVTRKILTDAMISKVGWGFYHDNKIDYIPYRRFLGLPDEFDGSIKAGIWFFKIDNNKPLSVILYELDGYTKYRQIPGHDLELVEPKRAYKSIANVAEVDREDIAFLNYPSFPIVPLHNINDQSSFVGVGNILKALDEMLSKMVDNVSQGDLIYWVLRNYGGMSENDAEMFVNRLVKSHTVQVEDDGDATPHQLEVPYAASEATISVIKKALFDGMMGVDTAQIYSGNTTATAINAAYENLNIKEALLEYEIGDFLRRIFKVAGIPETESFHISPMKTINNQADVQAVIAAYSILGDEATTKKLCELFGMIDSFEEIQESKTEDGYNIFNSKRNSSTSENEGEGE